MWDRLAVEYHERFCRRARLILRPHEDPENAVGEMWWKALRAADRYDPRRPPYPWLARILVNTCLNQRRGLLRLVPVRFLSDPPAPEGSPLEADGARAELRLALGRLSRTQRNAIVLRYLFGIAPDEVAAVEGCSRSAYDKRVERGIAKLRSCWPKSKRDDADKTGGGA